MNYYVEPLTGLVLSSTEIAVYYVLAFVILYCSAWLAIKIHGTSSSAPSLTPADLDQEAARLRAESRLFDAQSENAVARAAFEDAQKFIKRRK